MKIAKFFIPVLLVLTVSFSGNASDAEKYLGRWALHFDEGMGWLEVRQEDE